MAGDPIEEETPPVTAASVQSNFNDQKSPGRAKQHSMVLRHRTNTSLDISSESQIEVSSGQLETLGLLRDTIPSNNSNLEVPPTSSAFFKVELEEA